MFVLKNLIDISIEDENNSKISIVSLNYGENLGERCIEINAENGILKDNEMNVFRVKMNENLNEDSIFKVEVFIV